MKSKALGYVKDSLVFFAGFVRHPFATGAILPSSRSLAKALIRIGRIKPGSLVVEYGPGTGSCTKHLIEAIGSQGKLIGLDTNRQFVEMLAKRFPQGIFIHDGAENTAEHLSPLGIDRVDTIVCGLPFATIPLPVQRRILETSAKILKPEGTFLSFQYCLTMAFPRTRAFKSMLSETFEGYRLQPVWLNLPPAIIVSAHRNGNGAAPHRN